MHKIVYKMLRKISTTKIDILCTATPQRLDHHQSINNLFNIHTQRRYIETYGCKSARSVHMHNVKKKIKMERQDNSILLQNKIGIIIFEKHRFTYIYSGSYRAAFFCCCKAMRFASIYGVILRDSRTRKRRQSLCRAHVMLIGARTPPSSCVRNKSCLFISSQLIYIK